MKKIAFIIPTLGGGGAEKILINIVNNMDKKKYDITLISIFNYGINKKFLKEDIKYISILNKPFRGNKHIQKVFNPETLFKKVVKQKYDVIISFCEGITTRIVAGCKDKDVVLINWVHNEEKKYISSIFRNKKEMIKLLKKYDKNIFVADTALKSFEELTNNEIKNNIVIRNPIDVKNIILKSKEKLNLPLKETFRIISIGRLVKAKGYSRLIKIHKKLIDENIKNELWILGEGEEKENLQKLIRDLGVSNTVKLLGYTENPYPYIKESDLFVCSSYVEGYSTATIEALILEKPIVTTNCSGMKEILENGKDGIIVNGEKELLNAIKLMIVDDKIREEYIRKVKIRKSFFEIEKNINKIQDELEKLMGEKG